MTRVLGASNPGAPLDRVRLLRRAGYGCRPPPLLQPLHSSPNPRNLSGTTAVLREPSSSLNHRFYPQEIIRTRAGLICEADGARPEIRLVRLHCWRTDPDRAVGLFARSHAFDVASRAWIYTMEREKYSIFLTKFMIVFVDIEHLVTYCAAGSTGR
ncbi:transferase [Striga asiatica]|uniref:Transferase n=1 Tax=Striga asiatica TaxID=4170 RepID=A0A5A7PNP1_STRAF|nr:transferase [Striga asiatica]